MKALLVLEDGFSLEAESFTGAIETSGQTIFHTAMLGYQEIITDPALAGKFICFTYPLLGSYGINLHDMESNKAQVGAVLCREICHPSNWQMHCSLPDFLKEQGIPGLQGVNTRSLTKHLRKNGSLRAAISTSNFNLKALQALANNFQAPKFVTSPYTYSQGKQQTNWQAGQAYAWSGTKPRLLVFDLGISNSLLQILEQQGFELLVSPICSAIDVQKSGAQAIFISDGSGDPHNYQAEIEIIKQIKLPLAGVRLGHLLLGQALGGKLIVCNHHGTNHPVQNATTGKVEVAGQNHCFALDLADSQQLRCTHSNLHDHTLEGFVGTKQPIFAVQHYNTPANAEADSFFRDFYQLIQAHN